MQQVEGKGNDKISRIIVASHKKIDKMISHQASIELCYRKTCADLMGTIKTVRVGLVSCQPLLLQLESCLKKIMVLVEHLQIQKYGHKFPLFSRLIRKYERVVKKKLEINAKEASFLKLKLNERQIKYTECYPLLAISSSEISFLRSVNFNSFIIDLTNNEHVLQNPNCVGCSQVLVKNQQFINTNSLFPEVLVLTSQNCVQNIILERHVNALCNQGGGIILIGGQQRNGGFGVSGIRYRSYQQIIQRQQQLIATFKNIRPFCSYSVETLFVHTNYCDDANVADQYLRVCFRLRVYPQRADKFSYLQFSTKGYQNVHEIYHLNNQKQPEKVLRSENLYTKMYEKYYQKKQCVNVHQNIFCSKPYPNYSKIFNSKILSGELTQQNLISMRATQQIEDMQGTQKLTDDPNFLYTHTSLLAVVAQKDDRYIEEFFKYLLKCKQEVALSKPFQNSFKNCSRSIWMLSHKKPIFQINEHLINCIGLKQIPVGTVYLIPVQKMLQIQRLRLSEFQQKVIERRFKQRYNEVFKKEIAVVMEKNKEKEIFYLIFNDFAQAIYAYLSFEQLHLRPYFVRENSLNKNKPKTTNYQTKVDNF